ncbi:MAG: heparinase II/III domain-containing protein, partial [Gammaproteobacteria bacterium]
GYLRLADPVMHQRRITLEKRDRRVLIEDSLRMMGTHDVELFFHCSEHCRVEPVPGGYRISHGERALSLHLPQAADAATGVNYGCLAPISGWVSRKFDEKQPTSTIYWRGRLAGNSVLRSEIAC